MVVKLPKGSIPDHGGGDRVHRLDKIGIDHREMHAGKGGEGTTEGMTGKGPLSNGFGVSFEIEEEGHELLLERLT